MSATVAIEGVRGGHPRVCAADTLGCAKWDTRRSLSLILSKVSLEKYVPRWWSRLACSLRSSPLTNWATVGGKSWPATTTRPGRRGGERWWCRSEKRACRVVGDRLGYGRRLGEHAFGHSSTVP